MNPQIEQKITELSDKIESLESKINYFQESKNVLEPGQMIDRYLDEQSKIIIEQVVRRFYIKTPNTVGAAFTLESATQYHQLTGTAARTSNTTTAIKDGLFQGQILIIEGTSDTNTITIKDSANTKLAGDAVLGLNDTLTIMWSGDDWIELCRNLESSILTITHGTYTPTRSAEANLDASATMFEAQYIRVGNTVTVSGRFTADPTLTATATSFEMTLPIASNIGAVEDLAGVAFCGAIVGQGAQISGSVANDTMVVTWVSGDVTAQSWSFVATYSVI